MLPFLQLIFALAIIIAAAKLGGYLSQRLGQPTVAGKVLVGLILGPSLLNFLHWPMFTDPSLGATISPTWQNRARLPSWPALWGLHLRSALGLPWPWPSLLSPDGVCSSACSWRRPALASQPRP